MIFAVRHVNPSGSVRSRFKIVEIEKAPYIHVNTLFIGDVRPIDFGNYTCLARSAVETAKEVISLREHRIPTTSTSTTERSSVYSNDVNWVRNPKKDNNNSNNNNNKGQRKRLYSTYEEVEIDLEHSDDEYFDDLDAFNQRKMNNNNKKKSSFFANEAAFKGHHYSPLLTLIVTIIPIIEYYYYY